MTQFKPGLQDFIGTLIEYRRKLRHEFPGGVDHYDNYVFNRSELKRIPERLRPQPKKLSDLQQAVYDVSLLSLPTTQFSYFEVLKKVKWIENLVRGFYI